TAATTAGGIPGSSRNRDQLATGAAAPMTIGFSVAASPCARARYSCHQPESAPAATRLAIRLDPRSSAIADFTASADGSAASVVASQTPATTRGALKTRRQPVRNDSSASDVERIRQHEILEPDE